MQNYGAIKLAATVWLFACPSLYAQENTEKNTEKGSANGKLEEKDQKDSKRSMFGFDWGLGFSFTFDNGNDRRVAAASVDEAGIVRVSDEENTLVGIVGEVHYFLPCVPGATNEFWSNSCGVGPFLAVQTDAEDLINAAGLGLMVGLKYPESSTLESYNIGIGIMVDPNGQILGDGVEENQPLPAGETTVRFKEKQQYGWVILVSFDF